MTELRVASEQTIKNNTHTYQVQMGGLRIFITPFIINSDFSLFKLLLVTVEIIIYSNNKLNASENTMWSFVMYYQMTYSNSLWHKQFCVTTNVVGAFGWPGNSLNELNLIYILSIEDKLQHRDTTHSTVVLLRKQRYTVLDFQTNRSAIFPRTEINRSNMAIIMIKGKLYKKN